MKNKKTMTVLYLILALWAVVNLYPILWTVLSSFKTNTGILMDTMGMPDKLHLENYTAAWEGGKMLRWFFNTIVVSICATALNLLITSMAVYILARVRPNMALYTYFVAGLILPVYVIMLPLFKVSTAVHLNNSFAGLTIVYMIVNIPQTFFILYGYMKDGIPMELEDAARIDGCSRLGIFVRIILPLLKPGLATVGIFSLLFCWNEYLLPLVLMNGDNMVLSVAIRQAQATYVANYGVMCARLVLSFIPVILLYVIFQKGVTRGITSGAVKG